MVTIKGLAVVFLLIQVGIKAEEAFFTTSSSLEFQEQDGTITINFTLPDSNITGTGYTAKLTVFHDSTDDGDVTLQTDFDLTTNSNTVTATITLKDDLVYEGPETFIVEVTANLGTTTQGDKKNFTVTINDDELMPVNLTVPEITFPFPEHQGPLEFAVLFEDETPRSVDYPFYVTFAGSAYNGADAATSGDDFTPVIEDEKLVIEAGQISTSIAFNITDDAVVENTEHIEITVYGANLNQNYSSSIYIKDNDEIRYFDCSRFGQECGDNGTCNKFTCDCDCDTGFQGFDCSIESSSVESPCDVACVNGTCVNNDTAHTCVCDEGYTGVDCSQNPYQVKCDDDFVSVCLDIAGDFQGKVILDGRPACVINETDPDCNGLYGKFPITGEDNCKATFNNETDPEQSELTVFIQFNPIANTGDNQVVLMHCQHQGAGNYTVGEADPANEAAIQQIKQPDKQEPVTQDPPITATGVIEAGFATLTDLLLGPIKANDVVIIGTPLIFCYTAKANTGGFRFWGIVLTNGLVKGDPLRDARTLFTPKGCRHNRNDGIVLTDLGGNAHKKCFTFLVVKLRFTKINEIVALVEIIPFGVIFTDNLCQGGGGRKKRQAQTDESVGTQGTVRAVYSIKEETSTEAKRLLKECERSLMLPATIGLAIVCFTLLVIVILLAVTVIRNNRYKSKM